MPPASPRASSPPGPVPPLRVSADARSGGTGPGGLEARGDAGGIPRLGEDAAHRPARLDRGHGGGARAHDHARKVRPASVAARHVPRLRRDLRPLCGHGHARLVQGTVPRMRVALPTRRAYVVAALLGVGALDLHATAVGLRAHTRLLAHTLSGARM